MTSNLLSTYDTYSNIRVCQRNGAMTMIDGIKNHIVFIFENLHEAI